MSLSERIARLSATPHPAVSSPFWETAVEFVNLLRKETGLEAGIRTMADGFEVCTWSLHGPHTFLTLFSVEVLAEKPDQCLFSNEYRPLTPDQFETRVATWWNQNVQSRQKSTSLLYFLCLEHEQPLVGRHIGGSLEPLFRITREELSRLIEAGIPSNTVVGIEAQVEPMVPLSELDGRRVGVAGSYFTLSVVEDKVRLLADTLPRFPKMTYRAT